MLNAPRTFYWEEYDFELNRDMYSRRITWNPPSFEWAKNHWNGNHCEQYCYLCLYFQPTKTALCYLAIFKADLSVKSRPVTVHTSWWYYSFKCSTCIIRGLPSHSLWMTTYYRFACSCSGLLIKILPMCISLKGIAGHQFQNTEFPQRVFRLISRESLDQHITPLGDHMHQS